MKIKAKDFRINYTYNAREFVGVKFEDNLVNIYLPPYYNIDEESENDERRSILKFLKTIKLCKSYDYNDELYSDLSINGGDWAIDSYSWIIEDYISNGDFLNLEKKYLKSNTGKINWKRTLRKTPLLSNGNYIYLDFYVTKNDMSRDIITDIYRYCLNIALSRLGWLYGFNFQVDVSIKISLRDMIRLVNKELNSIFDDHKLQRLKNVLRILNDVSNSSSLGQTSFGTKNYYIAYEVMIDKMFGNVSDVDKSKYFPQAEWVINNEVTNSSKLKPDTICKVGNETYIVDAKMYSYGNENLIKNLPGTVDINKQITYGEYAAKEFVDEQIHNVFILPYDGEDKLRYEGYAITNWKNNLNTYEFVHAVLVNFNYLVDNYSVSDSSNQVHLSNLIKENAFQTNNKIDI